MPQVVRSALVTYQPIQLFDLVNDVERYADFLPWCNASEVHEKSDDHMLATVNIAKGGVNKSFTTKNSLQAGHKIEMALVDGPFSKLEGVWEFLGLGESGQEACKISLNLHFEFASPVLRATFGKVFDQVANSLVDAFVQRAHQVYGNE